MGLNSVITPAIPWWFEDQLFKGEEHAVNRHGFPIQLARDIFALLYYGQPNFGGEADMDWWSMVLASQSTYMLKMWTTGRFGYSVLATQAIIDSLVEPFNQAKQECENIANGQAPREDPPQEQQQGEGDEEEQDGSGEAHSSESEPDGDDEEPSQNQQQGRSQQQQQRPGQGQQQQQGRGQPQPGQGQPQQGRGQGQGQQRQGQGQPSSGRSPNGTGRGKLKWNDILNDPTQKAESMRRRLQRAVARGVQQAAQDVDRAKQVGELLGYDREQADDPSSFVTAVGWLDKIMLNKNQISRYLKESVSAATESLFGKPYLVREPLETAESPIDFLNPETLLNPAFFTEAVALTMKRRMKLDVYVDNSASMSDSTEIHGARILRVQLAVLLALKLHAMKLLDAMYLYNTSVHTKLSKPEEFFKFCSPTGGTHADACITQIINTGRPAIILTDGYDRVSQYDRRVFWLCLDCPPGGQAEAEYIRNGQMAIWSDGVLRFPRITGKDEYGNLTVDY